jgi:hypothetical protein
MVVTEKSSAAPLKAVSIVQEKRSPDTRPWLSRRKKKADSGEKRNVRVRMTRTIISIINPEPLRRSQGRIFAMPDAARIRTVETARAGSPKIAEQNDTPRRAASLRSAGALWSGVCPGR